ncbi:hypothetical protein K5I29_02195 [Flavobacterium agricola]|uniref:Arm DNA-binding domain-containing protein n=1 Tax=Flavobacterium agricola TaxID=2870839 RepID=A0ABY6M213_9FLAO|nr:hypothetical protein [Flavobacterium agricola]UYW01755.1 hypothetical protein K5I29_02195 [Flavobacterium agricola]
MSAISFSFRSTKEIAPLEIRLSYRIKGDKNPKSFYTRSRIEVDKKYWDEFHFKSDFPNYKDIEKQNWVKEIKAKQHSINVEIENIKTYLLSAFNSVPQSKLIDVVNKKWLEDQIELYYNPVSNIEDEVGSEIPKDLISYIDFYIDYRKNEMKLTSVKKYNVVKHKLERFEKKKERRKF